MPDFVIALKTNITARVTLKTNSMYHTFGVAKKFRHSFMGRVLHVLFLKKNQNAPRPSEHPPVREGEMSKRLGGIKGCKYKTSS